MIWSDDCFSCLCNLPHSQKEHEQAVEQAAYELQQELEWLKRLNQSFDDEDFHDEISDSYTYPSVPQQKGLSMQIDVQTTDPNHFIQQVSQCLFQRWHDKAQVEALLDGRFNGKRVAFRDLTDAQFNAIEDTAVRLGLAYDASQEELPVLA